MELDEYMLMQKKKDAWTIDFTIYKDGLVRGKDEEDSFYLNCYDFEYLKQLLWNNYWYLFHREDDYEDDYPALFINLKENKKTGESGKTIKIDNWVFKKEIVRIIEETKERELPNYE